METLNKLMFKFFEQNRFKLVANTMIDRELDLSLFHKRSLDSSQTIAKYFATL